MQTIPFEVRGEYVELCDLLKLAGIADSGGQGKQMVADGQVRVDGQVELRKRAKIRPGQQVEFQGQRIQVVEAAS